MSMKRSWLKRKVGIRKRRPTPRRGEPTPQEKTAIRNQVYEETGGKCELHLMPNCMRGILPLEGGIRERWHLVHKRAKRRFGWSRENLCGGCPVCHLDGLHTKGLKLKEEEC